MCKEGLPIFHGEWILVEVEGGKPGDEDLFMKDLGQPKAFRMLAKSVTYGRGFVEVSCHQDGESFKFEKKLANPIKGKSVAELTVGQGTTTFQDDIGEVISTHKWEGQTLVFEAKTTCKHGYKLTMLMYLDAQGRFIEEMRSENAVIKYIFDKRT